MRTSIRKKINIIFIIIVAAAMLIIGLVHWFLFDDFYEREKRQALIECFAMISSPDADMDQVAHFCLANNLNYTVTDSSLYPLQTNVRDVDRMATQLFGAIMDKEDDNLREIMTGANFSISRFHDERRNTDLLQLLGELDDGGYVMLQSPLESIEMAASISNRFYLIVAFIVVLVSVLAITLVTRRLTAQVEELTEVSGRMANLDFSAKYLSGGQDEIGKLGENFNIMSDNLEKTMSGLKSANVRLAKDIEEKTQIDERRREFLSNVSHELKTPIALIQGYAEGLKEMEMDKESQEMYLDVIVDEAVKMNRLVMQLMNLEQIESGNDSLDMTCFNLTELIQGVLSASQLMIEQAGASVRFDSSRKILVWADEFKTEQILTNYITNAINHLDGERIIEITCEQEGKTVTTTVFNTGEPIPEESLDMIWNKFYKVDKARTRSYGGSGIGLSIVKAITDAMGQKCSAKNYRNGVAFSFTLEAK